MGRMHKARSVQAGFSLVEMLVSVAILAFIILAAAALFDTNNKLSRVQSDVAEMQQSLRIGQQDMVRALRMAGRGGLPLQDAPPLTPVPNPPALPAGLALRVDNQVAGSTHIAPGNSASPLVLEGTDVLTVRGVLNSAMFVVDWNTLAGASSVFSYNSAAGTGTVQLCFRSGSGILQDFSLLEELLDPTSPSYPREEGLILVNRFDDRRYAVVELDPTSSASSAPSCPDEPGLGTGYTLAFKTMGGNHTPAYAGLSPGGDTSAAITDRMQNLANQGVSFVGVLEEYRYYVREERANPTDPSSDLVPVLTRSRFYPNTDNPYPDPSDFSGLALDLAENVLDLQVSLGLDTDGDGDATEDPNNAAADEWLLNDPSDPTGAGLLTGNLLYVRLSTLARTDRPDFTYEAPVLNGIEDHEYDTSTGDLANGTEGRMFRRRQLQTTVSLRNPFQL